jgi:hypothetical protein
MNPTSSLVPQQINALTAPLIPTGYATRKPSLSALRSNSVIARMVAGVPSA